MIIDQEGSSYDPDRQCTMQRRRRPAMRECYLWITSYYSFSSDLTRSTLCASLKQGSTDTTAALYYLLVNHPSREQDEPGSDSRSVSLHTLDLSHRNNLLVSRWLLSESTFNCHFLLLGESFQQWKWLMVHIAYLFTSWRVSLYFICRIQTYTHTVQSAHTPFVNLGLSLFLTTLWHMDRMRWWTLNHVPTSWSRFRIEVW